MGMESVEMIMAVEERFGIEIPDDIASEMRTVGDLYLYVLGRMHEKRSKSAADHAAGKIKVNCLSSHLFYLIRRTLQWTVGVERSQVRRDSPLDNLIPLHNRRLLWDNLRKGAGLKLPNLQRPAWLAWSLAVCVCVIPVILIGCIGIRSNIFFGSLLISGLIAALAIFATIPLARCFPNGCMDVEGLVILASEHNTAEWILKQTRDIWPVLKEIIAKELGVKPEEVIKKASFADDLGMDQ